MRKILIIDDERKICESFKELLEMGTDYHVLIATDGNEGLWLIKQEIPELVVLDWRLKSKTEGKDVLIYAKKDFPQVPVFVVTASVHSADEIKSLGADRILFKPCEDIKEVITEFLFPSRSPS